MYTYETIFILSFETNQTKKKNEGKRRRKKRERERKKIKGNNSRLTLHLTEMHPPEDNQPLWKSPRGSYGSRRSLSPKHECIFKVKR